MKPLVGFAGLTHLGLVSASAVCGRGFPTVCYDPNEKLIGELTGGRLPIVEPGLAEIVRQNGERQRFSASLSDLAECSVVYIAPDIPTDEEGQSDTRAILHLIEAVARVLHPDAAMVVLSQVEPGFTRALPMPVEARRYYQVETLVFGRAVERATQPERYIVGCADPATPLDANFRAVLEAFACPILLMRYESAELAKIAINFCLVSSISVANTLAEVCESVGADWSEIVPALKLDRRIGQFSYLAPGLGIAGGNLERDLATIERIGARHGTDTGVVAAWKRNGRHRRDWAVRTIRANLLNENAAATIAIWGLAYKENTNSTRNSPSLATIAQLPGTRLNLHDPVVAGESVQHTNARAFGDPISAVDGVDALMILTPWPLYRTIAPAAVAKAMKGRLVLDPYGVFAPQAAAKAGLVYHTLGRAPAGGA